MNIVFALSLVVSGWTSCYPPPVLAPIVEPFVAPACDYCPGHRGIEFDVQNDTPVRAAAAGVVSFSGLVAGTRYVIVVDDDGLTATYGMLSKSHVERGERVQIAEVIATADDRVYFGLRRADEYIDPAPLLGRMVRRPRLVPADGSRPRPNRPAKLQC